MSVLTLRKTQGRAAEAIRALASVHRKFAEGFGSANLKATKLMLERER